MHNERRTYRHPARSHFVHELHQLKRKRAAASSEELKLELDTLIDWFESRLRKMGGPI